MRKANLVTMSLMVIAFSLATTIRSSAQTLNTLVNFDGANGITGDTVIQGKDGNFYGTTYSGGANGNYGTVFKMTPDGTLTTLYSFCSQTNCTDGSNPYAGLLQGTNGNFYGTTYYGGANCIYAPPYGCGTVFEITPGGRFKTLYSFCSQQIDGVCADGIYPYAGLIQGTDGNFYGAAAEGGGNNYDIGCFCNGGGTIFRMTPKGQLSTLYTFCSQIDGTGQYCLDGAGPYGTLLQASDGNFYGTVRDGGRGTDLSGGTVFKLTSAGKLTTIHNFCSATQYCHDGSYPYAGLIQGSDGDLYGTTTNGGYNDWGTVFKITTAGALTTMHSFRGIDGVDPYAPLVQATNGDFYGTTSSGGKYNPMGTSVGTVFKLTSKGRLTTLYNFCTQSGCTGGVYPTGLTQGSDGTLYGTTAGDAFNDGTVYSLTN